VVRYFRRQRANLRVALIDENAGVRPTPVAIDNSILACDFQVRFTSSGSHTPLIRNDLSLQLHVLLG